MTNTSYQRIKAAISTLSMDESNMIIFALVNLKNDKFQEPFCKQAQEQATEYLKMRLNEANQSPTQGILP